MSELIQKNDNRAAIRWKLLTGASALALMAYVSSAGWAQAEDGDHPKVWIEFSGQLSRLQNSQEIYAPPFVALTPPGFTPPQKSERPPVYSIDESGKISFQLDNSDWTFTASIRYGRASSGKHVRHQSYPTAPFTATRKFHRRRGDVVHDVTGHVSQLASAERFTDAVVDQSENHTILDFQAGKDLGLGLFGAHASSELNIGVRIAQFRSKSRATLKEDPDWHFQTHLTSFSTSYISSYYGLLYSFYRKTHAIDQPYHTFVGKFRANRSFSGIGPSISWNSSVPFAGDSQDGSLSLDWGINAAILFGRQKAKTHHQTTAHYHSAHAYRGIRIAQYEHPATPDHTRSRNVMVPNVGGFAGISFNYADAKLSLGYKADFFFGAMDGGIDTAKKENRGFFGPYASISIGLGD